MCRHVVSYSEDIVKGNDMARLIVAKAPGHEQCGGGGAQLLSEK
jgi:hypothetical protein